jgi:predicted NAD/FAD-dependent oxidoreductase
MTIQSNVQIWLIKSSSKTHHFKETLIKPPMPEAASLIGVKKTTLR